jgi:hypothetical protein
LAYWDCYKTTKGKRDSKKLVETYGNDGENRYEYSYFVEACDLAEDKAHFTKYLPPIAGVRQRDDARHVRYGNEEIRHAQIDDEEVDGFPHRFVPEDYSNDHGVSNQ